MIRNYVFDVDGTLTPSRLPIDKKFEEFFLKWMDGKNVYLVTGSDKDKTIEQVGEKIWTKCTRVYQSCGNAVYEKGKLVKENKFKLDPELKFILVETLVNSKVPVKYGNHIEERPGLINFSTIGRNVPQEIRSTYVKWDNKHSERKRICERITKQLPRLEASIGGEISIDIYPKGQNKSQILKDLEGEIMFFGDKCEPGGNDYPIVEKIKDKHIVHKVKDWQSTKSILESI
jgi:phosphomannomutase